MEFVPKKQGICALNKAPNPWHLHQRDKNLKCLTLKTNGAYFRKNYKAMENRKSALKGLVHRPIDPEIQCNIKGLKGA